MKSVRKIWEGFRKALPRNRPEPPVNYFSEADCSALYRLDNRTHGSAVDDQTWSDLSMQSYFDRLTERTSIFGKQTLYSWLRTGQDDKRSSDTQQTISSLMADPAGRSSLRAAIAPLRAAEVEIAEFIFENAKQSGTPRWLPLLYAIPPLMIVAALYAYFSPVRALALTGFCTAVGLLLVLFALHMRYDETIRAWRTRIDSVFHLLHGIIAVAALDEGKYADFCSVRGKAAKLGSKLSRWPVPRGLAESVRDYFDWFFLGKVRHYFKQVRHIQSNSGFLLCAYRLCGELEAAHAIAEHLDTRSDYCWVEPGMSKRVEFCDAVHPLLSDAHSLSVRMDGRGIFLTGQNGVGKSTLLRTIGLNTVIGRAFGFCYASRAVLPRLCVRTSIQNVDSLLEGESLYISELRRARELLQDDAEECTYLYIIDEIFRGTNYLESVSAAAALLDRLAEKGVVIVSSHNVILATLLANNYSPYYLSREAASGLPVLKRGVLSETNGISLLRAHGFDDDIERNALKVFDWLNRYLAHPLGGESVLEKKNSAQDKGDLDAA